LPHPGMIKPGVYAAGVNSPGINTPFLAGMMIGALAPMYRGR